MILIPIKTTIGIRFSVQKKMIAPNIAISRTENTIDLVELVVCQSSKILN